MSFILWTIGAPESTLDEPLLILPKPHDIIRFFANQADSRFSEFYEFYSKGLSLNEISHRTTVPVSTVRDSLIKGGVTLRTGKKANGTTIKEQDRSFTGQIPYGLCLIDGVLIPDPKEQKVIQKILELWQSGMAFIAIKRWLNDKNIKSKHNRQWNDKTVAAIVRRHNETKK